MTDFQVRGNTSVVENQPIAGSSTCTQSAQAGIKRGGSNHHGKYVGVMSTYVIYIDNIDITCAVTYLSRLRWILKSLVLLEISYYLKYLT